MSDITATHGKPEAHWRSPLFWWVMGPLLVPILGLTMVKDLYLTGDRPNPIFYLTVLLVSIAGSTLGGSIATRLLRQAVGWVDVLAIALITAFLGQVFENISKLTWQLVWGYPGWTYLLAILALGVAVGILLGEMFLAPAFTSFTGTSTPSS
jgi:hypothetical protein